ncbi:MAG: FliA/WhiG family RNA polymerase sigma factor [Verrucomicrobiae bacterium]|nr:FliA/WhiG family RNA polymerase sigma factor [Verrucomicrobiae bacterium]
MDTKTFAANRANRLAPVPADCAGAGLPGAALETMSLERPHAPASQPLPAMPDGPELWRLYLQQSGENTENSLVECYLPLVGSILNRLGGTLPEEVDRQDLYSAGLLGLLTALRKFNPATGVPFDTYARQRIRGAMLDEIRHLDWVPRAIRSKSKHFQQVTSRLEFELGRLPTRTESARALKISVAAYDELVAEIRPAQFIRLDSTGDNDPDGETCVGEAFAQPDQINPFDEAATSELKQVIFAKLKQMPVIQQQVLTLYYIEGLYLHEIAAVLKLTEGRICQIQSQAIQSLRGYLKRYENGIADSTPAAAPAKRRKHTVQVQGKPAATHSKNRPLAINSRATAPERSTV